MIMWIRSQDKKQLIKADDFTLFVEEGKFWICCNYSGVGDYSTEEKAMKVLDMIQKEIRILEIAKIECGCYTNYDTVFQMPSDEEVVL